MFKKISIFLFSISIFYQAQEGKEFYVSTQGSDNNSGTEEGCYEDEISDFIFIMKSEKGNNWKGQIELKVWRNQGFVTVEL